MCLKAQLTTTLEAAAVCWELEKQEVGGNSRGQASLSQNHAHCACSLSERNRTNKKN